MFHKQILKCESYIDRIPIKTLPACGSDRSSNFTLPSMPRLNHRRLFFAILLMDTNRDYDAKPHYHFRYSEIRVSVSTSDQSLPFASLS